VNATNKHKEKKEKRWQGRWRKGGGGGSALENIDLVTIFCWCTLYQ